MGETVVSSHEQGLFTLGYFDIIGEESVYYFEDFKVGDNKIYGSYEVDRQKIVDFAQEYDPQPAHLSETAAASTPFRRMTASGWHTCAMMMAMNVAEMKRTAGAPTDGYRGTIGVGIDELRWLAPVYPGDVLRCRIEILETKHSRRRPDMGLVRTQHELLNQDDVRVMRCVLTALYPMRPSD